MTPDAATAQMGLVVGEGLGIFVQHRVEKVGQRWGIAGIR